MGKQLLVNDAASQNDPRRCSSDPGAPASFYKTVAKVRPQFKQ